MYLQVTVWSSAGPDERHVLRTAQRKGEAYRNRTHHPGRPELPGRRRITDRREVPGQPKVSGPAAETQCADLRTWVAGWIIIISSNNNNNGIIVVINIIVIR